MKTWHAELLVVAAVATASAVAAGGGLHFLAALAVSLSFAHAQVAERLRESQVTASTLAPETFVPCVACLNRYLVAKEATWLALFALTGQWTALISIPLFLAYPLWRAQWRRVHPRQA